VGVFIFQPILMIFFFINVQNKILFMCNAKRFYTGLTVFRGGCDRMVVATNGFIICTITLIGGCLSQGPVANI
jgi:hypothetical protein